MKKTILMILIPVLGFTSVTFAREGEWVKKADMPTARCWFSTSEVNGMIYAIGGRAGSQYLSTVEMYDPASDTWTKKANMLTERADHCTCAVNGKIYAIGGGGGSDKKPLATVEEYDPVTDTWRERADMPSARFDFSCSVVNGKIYAIGGLHRGGIGLGPTTVEEYDPVTNVWRARTDMPTGRSYLSTCVVNGKIYAIGGGGINPKATVEEYDPVTDTWTRKTDMPTARSGLSTSVVNGKIYAIGGGTEVDFCFSIVEMYDPATDNWTLKTEAMPTARRSFGTSVVDGRIYAIGGQPDRYPAVTGATEEYQPISWPFARVPEPANVSLHPETWVTLDWSPGDFAVSHDIYFGDSFEDVNESSGETFRGNQTATFFSAGFTDFPYPDGLVRGKTYYWRVDEVNDTEPNSPWRGPIWNFTVPSKKAYNPDPADGAEFVDLNVELNWTAGLDAVSHTVYFGDNFDDVNNASGGQQQVKTTYTPEPLELVRTYYWRVDEFTGGRGGEMNKGDVWSFTTKGAAGSPDPFNDVMNVEMNPTLRWAPADNTTLHQVYFGISKETVRNANTSSPEYKGIQMLGIENYDPGILSPHTTYYWRVDEVNDVHPDSPWIGGVWSFTTGDFFLIDDFEDYDMGNKIWWTWKDGLGYADHPTEPPYIGNGTGSVVGEERTETTAGDFRIHTGSYSMPFWFDNDIIGFLKYSEATLTLTTLRDWTKHGINTLSIWFVSDWDWERQVSANDSVSMYVVLNDVAVLYHDDPDASIYGWWTEWRIDLQEFADLGIDLTNVDTFGIGFGDRNNPQPGGSGLMSFDDIRLLRLP